jgi:putative holliday junction resolvase
MDQSPHNIMALDVGSRRIGVALASSLTRFAQPLTTLHNSDQVIEDIILLIKDNNVGVLVIGIPRGLQGQITDQTTQTNEFIDLLKKHLTIPVYEQDEAVTSLKAESELKQRGKPYQKADVDALAAIYILEDYLHERQAISRGSL